MFAKKKYHMIGDSNQKGAGLEKTKSSLRTVIYYEAWSEWCIMFRMAWYFEKYLFGRNEIFSIYFSKEMRN